eukprot:TRINITY_DN7291_c0_g1_i2.p1 TRINITY_DN7291_c0_g1~~TRINITY_DN7291_c0_g1_i2.p1  ORF type:complete len:372 (-),score=55.59 TRINITY_DN7291_c0_g1_i2:38-1153(-)
MAPNNRKDDRPEQMDTMVWVGRVRSTTDPRLLEKAFEKFGPIVKIETGFGGFAFVEFEFAQDAEKAIEDMNGANVQNIGGISTSHCTLRGYHGAKDKKLQRIKGGSGIQRPPVDDDKDVYWVKRRPRSRSRSRGRRSRSRSGSRSRGSSPASRSRSFSRRRPVSKQRTSRSPLSSLLRPERPVPREITKISRAERPPLRMPLPKPKPVETATSPPRMRSAPSRGHAGQEPAASHASQNGKAAADEARGSSDCEDRVPGFLAHKDRAKTHRFFNGTRVQDILLEGAVAAGTPTDCRAALLYDFPRGFRPAQAVDGPTDLLEVLAAFVRGDGSDKALSAEVRQSLVTDARGRRLLRKSLVVNGDEFFAEEQSL